VKRVAKENSKLLKAAEHTSLRQGYHNATHLEGSHLGEAELLAHDDSMLYKDFGAKQVDQLMQGKSPRKSEGNDDSMVCLESLNLKKYRPQKQSSHQQVVRFDEDQ